MAQCGPLYTPIYRAREAVFLYIHIKIYCIAPCIPNLAISCTVYNTYRYYKYVQAGRPEILFFLPAFVTRLLTPRSRNSGCGLLLGCRSGLDGGHEKLTFFWRCSKKIIGQKPGNSSSDGRAWHRNRSGVVELVGREPLMFAKVENGVTKSCQNLRRKNRKNTILA